MDEPLVGVILPTRNRLETLPRALGSVLAQLYPHWRLFIIDDASTDGTPGYVAKPNRDGRITYIRFSKRRGASAARNAGILLAVDCDWIAYLDDDDEWYPNHLEVLAGSQGDADFLYSATDAIRSEVKRSRTYDSPWEPKRFETDNFIPTIAVLHKRYLSLAVGGWDETISCLQDYDLWVRMASTGMKAKHISVPTGLIHESEKAIHNDRSCGSGSATRRETKARIQEAARRLSCDANVEPGGDASGGS